MVELNLSVIGLGGPTFLRGIRTTAKAPARPDPERGRGQESAPPGIEPFRSPPSRPGGGEYFRGKLLQNRRTQGKALIDSFVSPRLLRQQNRERRRRLRLQVSAPIVIFGIEIWVAGSGPAHLHRGVGRPAPDLPYFPCTH